MDGCQNYDPFLGTLNIRCRIIIGYPKIKTITLTTTHIVVHVTVGRIRASELATSQSFQVALGSSRCAFRTISKTCVAVPIGRGCRQHVALANNIRSRGSL